MINFVTVDLILLALFIIITSIFIYTGRKNLKQEGGLILYRTRWGIKLINFIGKEYQKTLKFLSYVSITLGYILMAGILFLIIQSVWLYFTSPIAKMIKAPPIAPLIPYFPQIFGLESYFPSFPFIYFIISILIVASVHEFSHGIFAKRYGIRIKSTGFAFLKYFPAIFGAFVEQDDKQMNKKTKFEQMSVLSAGVFANLITAIIFYIILFWFFTLAFMSSGIVFNTYVYSVVNSTSITSINGINISNPSYDNVLDNLKDNDTLNKIIADNQSYVITKKIFEEQKNDNGLAILYSDSPAINAQLGSVITEINDVKIDGVTKLSLELDSYSPKDVIKIKTIEDGKTKIYNITLAENPKNKSQAYLGIGFYNTGAKGFTAKVLSLFPSYKKANLYYEPRSEWSGFIKDLLWWIVVINLLVAFFNMLPLGILDGGRFFYLTIWKITNSEKIAKWTFSFMTYFILSLLLLMMVKWVFNFF